MKIEKINNDKLKITLTVTDLHDQNIDFADLSLDTPKAHTFFNEILEKAFFEFGFEVNDSPIIIEASPISRDTLVIFISKVDKETVLDKLKSHTDKLDKEKPPVTQRKNLKRTTSKDPIIYHSDNLTNMEYACSNLSGLFEGQSMLYKLDEKYYLVLGRNRIKGIPIVRIEGILSEFTNRAKPSKVTLAHIEEYGEVLIKTRAVENMGSY
jgi:adapter protein MecA 1/2